LQPCGAEQLAEPVGAGIEFSERDDLATGGHDHGRFIGCRRGKVSWKHLSDGSARYLHTMGVERFAELMAGPADDFRLDEACLLIAAAANPQLEVAKYLGLIDGIAYSCPAPLLDTMLDHIYNGLGFAGNLTDYYDPRNSLLDHVLDRRLGIPISLAVVVMEVGRRIGVPVSGIGMPGHFLLRDKVDPGVFIDPFSGRLLGKADCLRLHQRLTGGSQWSEAFLLPVERRAIVVRVLTNLKEVAKRRNDLRMLQWVMKLRATIPTLGDSERSEFAALMSPLN
jgi:regulator of sirC expression with transglutaminase-like and TPR domain